MHSYLHLAQMLRLMLEDVLLQQEQIRAMAKADVVVTMDLLFGTNSSHNQHVKKTGTHNTLAKIWDSAHSVAWDSFDVDSFEAFWKTAVFRATDPASHFLFGAVVCMALSSNYRSDPCGLDSQHPRREFPFVRFSIFRSDTP
jgi:hypothetical protein